MTSTTQSLVSTIAPEYADALVKELEKRRKFVFRYANEEKRLIEILQSTEITRTGKGYFPIVSQSPTLAIDKNNDFSLVAVLHNTAVKSGPLNRFPAYINELLGYSFFHDFFWKTNDSKLAITDLEDGISNGMNRSSCPISLLGMLESREIMNEGYKMKKSPLIFIPGASDEVYRRIDEWSDKRSQFFEEKPLWGFIPLAPTLKRISERSFYGENF